MFEKKYIEDKDLEFLAECSNEDLKVLADLLVYDKDDAPRYSETLSKTRSYREGYPDKLEAAWKDIAHEFQLYGGDSVVNFVRGNGIPYRNILMDVCDKKKVNYNKKSATEKIEKCFIQKIFEDVINEMDDEQLKEVLKDLQLDSGKYDSIRAVKEILLTTCMSPAFVGKLMTLIASTIVPRFAVKTIAMMGLSQIGALFVPAINLLMAGWLAKDLMTGPAYRVTIPGVVFIIYMRHKLLQPAKE